VSNLTLYLAGPINGRTDAECIDWRKEAARLWGGPVLDPMRRDYRGKESLSVSQIVKGDLEDIRKSDAVLVMFDRPSVGTSMEVMYAHMIGVLVVAVDVSDKPLSPWLRYHASICHDLETAIKLIKWKLC
jgi:nucleoside 2-deoxyribosyltransferase